jgi:hypothetical protein
VADPNAQNAPSDAPPCGWASLGNVPVAQCVPASPTFSPYEGQLSPVTTATVARLLGTPSKD